MTYLGLNQSQTKTDSSGQKNSDDGQRLEDTLSKDLELQRSGNYDLDRAKIIETDH